VPDVQRQIKMRNRKAAKVQKVLWQENKAKEEKKKVGVNQ
jgi:hypothetical protein